MAITAAQVRDAASRWGLGDAVAGATEALAGYGNLLLQWNSRLSLTAIRDESELIERHLLEGLFAAAHHPPAATVLDFGSGTGVPGIPIGICRPDLRITLAESQRKKAVFLQEAIRLLELKATSVYLGRAETLPAKSFDAVWMRAVDRSDRMIPLAATLVAERGALCLCGTEGSSIPAGWRWASLALPGSASRVLHIGRKF